MKSNLRVGFEWGMAFAVIYSAFVIVLPMFRGSEPFREAHTSLPAVIAAYFAAGLVGGGIFGLLLPWDVRD